jgi:UPF0176 protein
MNNNYQVLLYYKYINIDDPQGLRDQHMQICQELDLKGRIIIANEGINGTLEGTVENTEKYVNFLQNDPRFADIHMKRSVGTGNAFPKLSVKVRSEIVSLHLGENDFSPTDTTGKYLQPEDLHQWFLDKREFYIVDMRNDYEHKVGFFKDSILPPLKNFRDLPESLPTLAHLKGKTVVTVCTGGVRCEKASGFLVKNGFSDVYQLYGGIVSYMEKYPNQDFLGKLYTFDGRVTMGFNTDSSEHVIVSKCDKCQKISDNYVDCAYLRCKGHRHFICCTECIDTNGNSFCSQQCSDNYYPQT